MARSMQQHQQSKTTRHPIPITKQTAANFLPARNQALRFREGIAYAAIHANRRLSLLLLITSPCLANVCSVQLLNKLCTRRKTLEPPRPRPQDAKTKKKTIVENWNGNDFYSSYISRTLHRRLALELCVIRNFVGVADTPLQFVVFVRPRRVWVCGRDMDSDACMFARAHLDWIRAYDVSGSSPSHTLYRRTRARCTQLISIRDSPRVSRVNELAEEQE